MSEVCLGMAKLIARRSTCKRLQVGCVITNWDMTRVLAYGYNGNHAGGPNTCDSDTPGQCGCCHSELNALVKAPYDAFEPLQLFCTHTPCKMCAKYIINSRVRRVVCAQQYRSSEGVDLLHQMGIVVIILPDAPVALAET